MIQQSIVGSDFWWLSASDVSRFGFVYVGHHPPLADDDDRPPLSNWFRSLDDGGLSGDKRRYPCEFLTNWTKQCRNRNVYRSLALFSRQDEENCDRLLGPFLVDIDNEKEDLDDALEVTRRAVSVLTSEWQLTENDILVFFSGHKGFNVEVRPSALQITGSYQQQLKRSCDLRNQLISLLRSGANYPVGNAVSTKGTILDLVYSTGGALRHPYVRLHDSINVWRTTQGQERARKRTALTLDELRNADARAIVARSEA